MIFHQPTNSDADVFNAFLYREIDYGAHFHRGCEILIVLKGVQKAVAGGKRYEVKTGEALFLCPYELHSYEPSAGAITFAIVFSGAYAEAFSSRHENETPAKSLFTIPRETLGFVLSKFFGAGEAETVAALFDHEERGRLSAPEIDGLTVSACLYALLAEFEKNAVYVKSERDDEFTYSAIDYVEKNFRADISVATLANALGYSYDYVSRLFAARFGIRFSSLVNRYRAEEAAKLMDSERVTATEAAMRSGFKSIRSFNRIFKSLLGRTPTGR